jgi:hypothetical protein
MLTRAFVCALALAVAVATSSAGCGGAGGVRRMMLSHNSDASSDITVLPPFKWPGGDPADLNCAAPFKLGTDGHVTDFSNREWNGPGGKWCDESGLHGSIFSFKGTGPNDLNAISVNTMDSSLRLALTVSTGSYGGGGIAFEAGCLDASAFTGLQFSIAVASGSLAGCAYQIQLQTFEQRPTTPKPAGGCDQNTTSCYSFPYVRNNLPAASTDPTMPTLVTLPFNMFSASMMPAPPQLVGLQWQVNSTSGQCTVELRIDDIGFIPAPSAPDAGSDDGGTADGSTVVDADTSS